MNSATSAGVIEKFDRVPVTITHAELMQKEFPPPKWGIYGLCPQGVNLLASKPKIGKSWFALQMCHAKASGAALWNGREPETQGESLYIALEDNLRRLNKRARRSFPQELNASSGALWKAPPLVDLHFATEWPRMGEGGVDELDLWLTEHERCDLVVVDTVARFRKRKSKSNDYADDYAVGSRLKKLADKHSVSILLVHHTRKQEASDPFDMVSGTQGLTGSVDATLVLTRERGQGNAGLYVTGRDIEHEVELAIRFNDEDCRWESDGKSVTELKLSERRQQIIDALRILDKPSTIREIMKQLSEDGITTKQDTLRKTIGRMVRDDHLSLGSDNRYTLSHVSNYG